ncbi:hypothetical protein NQ314_006867 [Rhamnusium bicolor]|uniref:Uncharacterized protein n=1 Tax=Rhamnusium bicolor TaxID=1586634 RepID=A0AAV8YVW9_9CUCU|nr:hypothetical protein NQ314_006867 [Rhamnusium bicolor]
MMANYYKANKGSEPHLENGFKPIKSSSEGVITQPNIPQTYKSNKKPATTLGLRHFFSNNRFNLRTPMFHPYNLQRAPLKVPYKYGNPLNQELKQEKHKAAVTRLYRSIPINNRYVRYAKHIN